MSGIAFYIDASFDAHLEISPTPSGDIPVMSLEIVGENSPTGLSAQYSVVYTPGSTTQKGVTWSVVSGINFAGINSQTGELSINETANGSPVKIRATSTADSSIYAEKELTVSYYVGEITAEINAFCDRVTADGGALLKGSKSATQVEFARHKSLLGVTPKIDFLGYKLDEGNNIIKLYSLDGRFDCTELTGISLKNGIITTNDEFAFIKWSQNFLLTGLAEMEHLYYEGNLTQINSADSIFIANLLKTSYEETRLKRSAVFFQGNKLNFQYAALGADTSVSGFPCSSLGKFKVSVDGTAHGERYDYVTSLIIDDGPDVSSQKENGADFWGRAIDEVSFIKLYLGYKLCIAG